MPIDTSMYAGIKGPTIESPLNALTQVAALQHYQGQNALLPLQLQQLQLANTQKQQQFDMIKPILQRMAGGQSAPANALASQPGMQPVSTGGNALAGGATPGGNPQGIPTDDGIPYSLQDLGALAAAGYPGAKEMLEVKKAAMQGVAFDQGKTYNVGGHVFTVPQLDKGMRMGANGQVEAIPGYAETNATIQGQQAGATEGAKLLPLDYRGVDGRPIGGTVGGYLGQPNAPQGQPLGPQGLDTSKLTPQQIAYLAQKDPQAFSNGVTHFQQTSMQPAAAAAPGGYTPPTVGVTGDPVPPQVQQMLASLAASRDPAKLQQFAAQTQQQIEQQPEGPRKQAAIAALNDEMQKIQQSWQAAGQGGRPSLQSHTEAALEAAKVKHETEPALGYATKASESLQKKGEQIGAHLAESQALLQRIAESRAALTKFKAGGGADIRVDLAQKAQALGMPPSMVDGIAGGNLSAVQEFQKYAAQEALQTMQQALASDTGTGSKGNRMAMELFIKNNPNITTDPNAIEKIFNFQTKLHNETLEKHDMFTKFISDPKAVKDPVIFDNLYAHHQIANGNVKPEMTQGQAMGTTPAGVPPDIAALLKKHGGK